MSRRFTTPIVLPGDPTNPLEAATKQYIDGLIAALGATYRGHNQPPRTQSVTGAAANIDVGAAGDLDVTVSTVTSTTLTPTNGQDGRTCVVSVTAASGATRTVTIGGSPERGEDIASAALAIPAGGTGRFIIRYSTLASIGYTLDSAYLVA